MEHRERVGTMIAAYNQMLERLERHDAEKVDPSTAAKLADAYAKLQHYTFVLKKL
ncbi:MAG: hypothetical protein M1603_03195 [Candidatus Marsarchaeota archaeon]|jgi:hypothetical protein|nr:hypothetical protein [Candidatus Marsarchaeota archaeon]